MKKLRLFLCLACVFTMCAALLPAVAVAEGENGVTMYVSASRYTNMRDQPTTEGSNIIEQVPANAAVTALRIENKWVEVIFNEKTGFIYIDYLTTVNPNDQEGENPGEDTGENPGENPGEDNGENPGEDTPSAPVGTEMIIKNGPQKLLSAPQEGSAEIATYPVDTTVIVIFTTATGWARVAVEDQLGYMPVSAFDEAAPDEGDGEDNEEDGQQPGEGEGDQPATPPSASDFTLMKVKGGRLAFRSAPEKKTSNIITFYNTGTEVKVFSINGIWAQVAIGEQIGYMMASYLEPIVTEEDQPGEGEGEEDQPSLPSEFSLMKVKGGKLAFRSAPEKKTSNIITFYNTGTEVKVYTIANGWAHVSVNGQPGYMMASYLEPVVTEEDQPGESEGDQPSSPSLPSEFSLMKVKGGKLAFRSAPEKKASNIITFYNTGTEVKVYTTANGWAHVSVDGQPGYMMASYLEPVVTEVVPPVEGEGEQPGDGNETIPGDGEGDENVPEGDNDPAPAPATKQVFHPKGSYVNFRSSATDTTEANILGKIPSGTTVEVISVGKLFTKIIYNGKTGYINSNYLR